MKINEMSVGATVAGSVASVPSKMGKVHKRTEEAANPAQQAAIAVSMKKAGKKPKNLKEGAVKQLIMDLRELKDKEFMKKYGKSKEEMKQGLKSQVDENMFDKITSFIGRPFDQEEISKDIEKRNTQVSQNMQTPNATRYSNHKITREGEVTKTSTGLKHKATDKYGAGEDPEGFNQKYARDLTSLSKSEVKRLDNIHGVKWKNRGSKGVAEALGLYGPFTVTINTGERPQSRTKTKKFRREDDAILWAQDWLEDAPQYVFATAEVTDPDGNVVWTTDESLEEQGVAEAHGPLGQKSEKQQELINMYKKREEKNAGKLRKYESPSKREKKIKQWIDFARTVDESVYESAILQGMQEARVTEDELLLMPGQGIRFKPELMPKKTDHEVEMARQQLIEIAQNAEVIYELIQGVSEMQGLDAWIQKKIVIANDYMESVSSYLRGRMEVDEQIVQPIPPKTSSNQPNMAPVNPTATRPAPLAGGTTTQAGTSPQQVNTANLTGTGYQQGNSVVKANPNQIQQDVGTSQAIGGTLKNIDSLRQGGPNTFAQIDPAVHNMVGGMKTAQQDVNKRLAVAGVGQTQPIQTQQPQQPKNFSQYADDELEEDSVREKLHRRQQELRKKSGLPDPNYYKELKGTYDMPDDERWARTAELKKKYKVKEQEADPYYIQEPKPQPEPKQGVDVKKGLGLLSTIGRALNTVTSPTFGDDVKADIRTMIHNKVTGTPNK